MENSHFVPSYKIPENNQADIPKFYVNKAEIKPIYGKYSSSAVIDQNTKDDKFLKTLFINNYPSSSSSPSFSLSSHSVSTNAVPSFQTPLVGQTQTLGTRPNHPILQHSRRKMNLTRSELFPSVSNSIDSYGRPLANVIQIKPAESYSDSYGDPLGQIITNNIQGGPRPLSTNSLSLNNLNKQDSYGQPLSPVIRGESGPQLSPALVEDSESEVSRARVKPLPTVPALVTVTTEVPVGKTNKNLFTDVLAVFPQPQGDSELKGIGYLLLLVLSSIYCQEIMMAWMITLETKRQSRHQ